MITNDSSPLSQPGPTGAEVLGDPSYVPPPTIEFTPDNPPWGFGRAFLVWGISVTCLLIIPLLLVFPYIIYVSTQTGVTPSEEVLTRDKMFILLSIIGVIPSHLITLLIAWALVTRWGRFSFSKILGLSWPRSVSRTQGLALCVGLAVLLYALGIVITYFIGGGKTQMDMLIESSYQARIATAFLAVATAPLVEEIVYRGILYPALQRLVGTIWGIVVVSLLFSLVHVYQYWNHKGVILVITVLSIALTAVRAYSGRLLPSIVVHLIFNGITTVILLVSPFLEKPEATPPPTVPALIRFCSALQNLF